MIFNYGTKDDNPVVLCAPDGTTIHIDWIYDLRQVYLSFTKNNKSVKRKVRLSKKSGKVIKSMEDLVTECTIHV
jgi:hypothetical protein